MATRKTKRAKKVGRRRPGFNKDVAWMAINASLHDCVTTPISERGHRKLVLEGYTALVSLERGALTPPGYLVLNRMNAFAHCLFTSIEERGTEAVREKMRKYRLLPAIAADALVDINGRFEQHGRYGATGEQLRVLRAMMSTLDQLVETAPIGVVVNARAAAERMVANYIGTKAKEVA